VKKPTTSVPVNKVLTIKHQEYQSKTRRKKRQTKSKKKETAKQTSHENDQ
jgi:hypothetical protein